MSKIGKSFLAKLVGGDKSYCCGGPSTVSVRNIEIDGKVQIVGLDEEFEKYSTPGKAPEDVNGEELIQNITKIIAPTLFLYSAKAFNSFLSLMP